MKTLTIGGRRTLAMAVLLAVAVVAAPAVTEAAATAFTSQKIIRSGVAPTPVAVDWANGNSVALSGGELLRVTNVDSGQAITVTITDQKTSAEGYSTDATVTFAGSDIKYIGPFIASRWADTTGLLQISYGAGTQPISPTVEVMRLPYGERESSTK